MFDGRRYITREVNGQVGLDLQMVLWSLIDQLKNSECQLDYLQIFECDTREASNGRKIQRILHRQEVPPYRKIQHFVVDVPIQGKLYAIDDGDHCTLLFASEY